VVQKNLEASEKLEASVTNGRGRTSSSDRDLSQIKKLQPFLGVDVHGLVVVRYDEIFFCMDRTKEFRSMRSRESTGSSVTGPDEIRPDGKYLKGGTTRYDRSRAVS
jgi:hypothetical protein